MPFDTFPKFAHQTQIGHGISVEMDSMKRKTSSQFAQLFGSFKTFTANCIIFK